MTRRTIMLAGVPTHRRSDPWTARDLSVTHLEPAFQQLVHSPPPSSPSSASAASPSTTHTLPAWRAIPAQPQHLATGWSQGGHVGIDITRDDHVRASASDNDLSFLTSTSAADDDDADDFTQYLEDSLALHAASTADADAAAQTPPPLHLPHLHDLSALPSATELARLAPQTVTADVLVGVIRVGAPRGVTVRRTSRTATLREVLVGDDTRAGFTVTFWLAQAPQHRTRTRTRHNDGDVARDGAVGALRPGDVVGLRNVALRAFRGVVQGVSLAGRGGAATAVVRVDGGAAAGGDDGAGKLGRVRRWAREFVAVQRDEAAGESARTRTRKAKRKMDAMAGEDGDGLPADESFCG